MQTRFANLVLTFAALPCLAQQWQVKAPLPEVRGIGAGAIVGDYFYLLGGSYLDQPGNIVRRPTSCWKYHIQTDAWSPIAPLPHNGYGLGGVDNVSAATVGKDIYLIGGYAGNPAFGGGNFRPDVRRYDTLTNTWEIVASDPYPSFEIIASPFQSTGVGACPVVALDGKIYVIGGVIEQNHWHARTLVYDPAATAGARWQEVAAINAAPMRVFHAATVIDGQIWIGGGAEPISPGVFAQQLRTFEVYDPALNLWDMQIAQATLGRSGAGMFNIGGRPAIVSGGHTEFYMSSEILDGGIWAAWQEVNVGARNFAYAQSADGRYLVKAGGVIPGPTGGTTLEVMDLGEPCYANCDGSTTPPVLNVADFGCFLQRFAAGDPYANCDGSTVEPVINVTDFSCFLQRFAAGCP